MRVTSTHAGLMPGFKPFDLPDLLTKLRTKLGIRDVDIAYLRFVIRHLRREDFLPGRICAVWLSAGNLAAMLGLTPRQLARIEERLEKLGLIARTWRRNGRRYGYRAPSGEIAYAVGVNLAPLIERVPQLAAMVKDMESLRQEVKAVRERANAMIGAIRALEDSDALAAAREIFPRLRPSEISDPVRLENIVGALARVLEDFSSEPSRTVKTAGSDDSVRPITDEDKITKTCTAENEPRRQRTATTRLEDVWLLASDRYRELLDLYSLAEGTNREARLDWNTVCIAARELAQLTGVTAPIWQQACDRLGNDRAALCLMIADRNSQRSDLWRVRNVPAAFRGMVRKEFAGQAVLESFLGELLRHSSLAESRTRDSRGKSFCHATVREGPAYYGTATEVRPIKNHVCESPKVSRPAGCHSVTALIQQNWPNSALAWRK